jgi:ubiquinone/menaquinone biosynthesis C-methylase UbiE
MEENKTIKYYIELATIYDKNRFDNSYGQYIDKQERIILEDILADKKEIVLDLGCGTGRLLNYASIGIDASKNMVDIAKRKNPSKSIYLCDAELITIRSESIDTIICFHFFMHLDLDKMNKILAECNRILKINGRLIFDIPSRKRRNLLNYKSNDWHGANSISIHEMKQHPLFVVRNVYGILFLPIHKMPAMLRKYFLKFDLFLANTFLKEYSSYLIMECKKRSDD